MAEKTIPSFVETVPSGEEHLGRVHLAPEVLEVIIGLATMEVDGVAHTKGNFASDVAEKFGKVVHGKGVKMALSEEGLVMFIALSSTAIPSEMSHVKFSNKFATLFFI